MKQVSILVVVDHAPRGFNRVFCVGLIGVSILVVVDHAPRVSDHAAEWQRDGEFQSLL